jgi:hypothetical protein
MLLPATDVLERSGEIPVPLHGIHGEIQMAIEHQRLGRLGGKF